jgi:hypothetical protein
MSFSYSEMKQSIFIWTLIQMFNAPSTPFISENKLIELQDHCKNFSILVTINTLIEIFNDTNSGLVEVLNNLKSVLYQNATIKSPSLRKELNDYFNNPQTENEEVISLASTFIHRGLKGLSPFE